MSVQYQIPPEAFPPGAAPPAGPRLVPYSRPWWVAKRTLHAISIGVAFAATVVAASFSADVLYWELVVPPALVASLWDAAELITGCARRRVGRGIHPGAHVGVEILVCLVGLFCAVALSLGDFVYRDSPAPYVQYHYSSLGSVGVVVVRVVCVLLLLILTIIHVTLFSRACQETHQRNRGLPSLRMVYVPGGGVPFVIQDKPAVVMQSVDLQVPPPAHTEEAWNGSDRSPIPDEEDLSLPPQKEVIPGFVR